MLNAISSTSQQWLEEVASGYTQDPFSAALLQELAVARQSRHPYTLLNGIIKLNDRIWIGDNPTVQQRVISAMHSSALGGHSGFPVTYSKMKKLFAWKGMKSAVRAFVQSCSTCLQAKPDRARYPGLLVPLPVPTESWQVLSMDFIEGLPRSGNANCVLVVVDKFSKFAHFIPLLHPFTVVTIAKTFLDNIYKLHGMPSHIISDRDRIFTSTFWRELFKLANTTLCMSLVYHPQSDGQTERVNQCLETYLRCFVHSCPRKWLQWLPLAEFWYNSSWHSSLGHSPFEVLYEHPPRHFGLSPDSAVDVPKLDSWMQEREVMLSAVRQHLLRAQQRMKLQADKKHSDRQFAIGDSVFLKLQPYVQSSLAPRANSKLCFKYFGPFLIIDKIGAAAYKLKLPVGSSIHPVFHVSLLKPATSTLTQVSPTLPDITDALQVPEQFLQRRMHPRGSGSVAQVLVKWSGISEDLSTWEDIDHPKQLFPFAPA